MKTDDSVNSDEYPKILNYIKENIENGNIVFFLGAGFSAPLGYPTAQNISESLCNKYKININYNLPETVDYLIKDKKVNKCDIVKYISELIKPDNDKIKNNPYNILREIIDENKNQEKIYIFTTNWDDEIDKAFNEMSYIMKNKKDYDNYENNLNNIINERVIIIKLHGNINNKDNNTDDLVITNEDVNKNKDNIKQLYNILSGEIWDKSILFMGYSLNDPEIDDIYKIMRGKSNKTDYFVTIDDKSNNIETLNVIPGKNSLNFISDLYIRITGKLYLRNIQFKFDNDFKSKIKNNKHIIVCGAKYTGKTMMSIRLSNDLQNNNYNNFDFPDKYCDDDLTICRNSLDKNNKACIFLTHSYIDYFMEDFKKNNISLKNVEFLDYSVNKDDASKFYDEIINEYKEMKIYDNIILDSFNKDYIMEKIIEDSKYSDKIMDYSTSKGFVEGVNIWIHGGKKYETYIPAIIESDINYLIKEMNEQCNNLNDDNKNKKIDEIYNVWTNKKEKIDNFLGLSGLALAETGIGFKDSKLMIEITGLAASVLSTIPITVPIALGIIFIGGYFGLKNWRDSKNENFLKNLYNAKEFWNELDDAKKRFISYRIERLDKKTKPETVYYVLENILGKNVSEEDFNKFKKDVYEYVDKNGKEILDKINNELKKLESEIQDLDAKLDEMQKQYNDFEKRMTKVENKVHEHDKKLINHDIRITNNEEIITELKLEINNLYEKLNEIQNEHKYYNTESYDIEISKREETLKEYNMAIKLGPDNPDYHYNKGVISSNLNHYEEALEEYNKAIKLNPYNAVYHLAKSVLLLEILRYNDALKESNIAIQLNPEPEYHNITGKILYYVGRYEDALKEYNIAIKINPNKPDYHNNKGSALLKLNLYEEALEELEVAIKINPNNPVYLVNYSEIMALMDNEIEGIKKISDALDNGLINKKELCEVVSNELSENISNKEKDLLIKIMQKYCE